MGYPAAYSEAIAVGATNQNDERASFSSTGPEIEVVAPGTDITTTDADGSCITLSGTSIATVHASGVGALLMAEGYTNAETRQRLRDAAEDLGLSSNAQGYGLVDAAAAMGLDSSDD